MERSARITQISDFQFVKLISRGTYGKVSLGYRKDDPQTFYAIKTIKKEDLVRKNMIDSIVKERQAFCVSEEFPFIVRMMYSLQNVEKVYLVMEYMVGGDLKSLVAHLGFFPAAMASFYVAEMALALDFIHGKGIIHRDIKPDNVLLDKRGHIKLTDFGLSRVAIDKELNAQDLCNFTPGQKSSLVCKFSFTPVEAAIALELKAKQQQQRIHTSFEQMRGNEAAMSCNNFDGTPLCSLENGSILSQTKRRFRKPLRNIQNVRHNKPTAIPKTPSPTSSKAFDINEYDCIKTPTQPTCTEFGSFLNYSLKNEVEHPTPSSAMDTTFYEAIPHFFHHSSPIPNGTANIPSTLKIQAPKLSPVLPSGVGSTFIEISTNDIKRARSSNTSPVLAGLNRSAKSSYTSKSPGSSAVFDDSFKSPPTHSSVYHDFKTPDNSDMSDSAKYDSSDSLSSPEQQRRDVTAMPNYVRQIENLGSSTRSLEMVRPKPKEHSLGGLSARTHSVTSVTSQRKRKRWTDSNGKTGISINMIEMGFSENQKVNAGSGGKIVGTPDYLAPEIIANSLCATRKDAVAYPVGEAVDWWSLGVCLYEFIVGMRPFCGESVGIVFRNIEYHTLDFPDGADVPDIDITRPCIEALLSREPHKRPTLSRLMSEEFATLFKDIPWNNMPNAVAPFVPAPTSPTDTGYFKPPNADVSMSSATSF